MKLTTRLTLIISALLLLFVAGTIVFQQSINKSSFKLAENKKAEIHQQIERLLNADDNKNATHYFSKSENKIVENFVDNNSAESKIVSTKNIDTVFCQHLSKFIDNSSIQLTNNFSNDTFNVANSTITVFYPLQNEKKQAVAYLQITVQQPVFAAFAVFLKKYNIFFIAFALAILSLLILAITSYINMPLNRIFNAMKFGREEYLESMENRSDEFGQLSRLIALSFNQKRRLLAEVEERKLSEDALRKVIKELELTSSEKEKAERADQAKSEFISNISHELRTPMNAVVSISSMLALEKLDDKQSNLVKVLNFSARQLTSLVSDILDFSKIESGTLEIDEEPFNLFAVCTEIVQMHSFKANENELKLFFDEDETLKRMIVGDPHRLNQVLVNLLSNAVKFTEKGQVNFSYKIVNQEDDIAAIKFTVKDTGIGIAKNDLDRIFERFNQANSEIHKKYGGTGLGLTLSKKLVELMGGKLEVESDFGKGSSFFFTLNFPMAKVVDRTEENKLKTASGTLEGLKVLVAEDHEINAFVLKQFFKQWKVEAVFAENGKLALDELVKTDFDVVLMDLQMPVMDGFEAVQRIRNHPDPKYKKVAIVALTANAAKETREHLLKNGFDLFISKPFDPSNLHQILYNVKKYYVEAKPDTSTM